MRFLDAITAEIRFLLDEQTFVVRLFSCFRRHLIRFDPILRRDDFLALINFGQAVAVVWINKSELELCHARKLFAYFLNFRGVEAWDLNQNPIVFASQRRSQNTSRTRRAGRGRQKMSARDSS